MNLLWRPGARLEDVRVGEVNVTCFMEEACEGELQVGGQAVVETQRWSQWSTATIQYSQQTSEGIRALTPPAPGLPASLLFASHPLHREQKVVHLGVFPADKRQPLATTQTRSWKSATISLGETSVVFVLSQI